MSQNIQLNIGENITRTSAGTRNEIGFVNGLDRQGFTLTKCGSEELANAIDAYSTDVKFILGRDIKLVDNGIGMTRVKLVNMFDAGRENHYGEKTMGVSGIGGIISNYKLSKNNDGKPSKVNLFTKHKDGPYLKAIIPWDTIHTTKNYDNQIVISPMNDIEIETFKSERSHHDLTGTTIIFPYSNVFKEVLNYQFNQQQEQTGCHNLDDWWAITFGKTETNIWLDKCNGLPLIKMRKYNYFSGRDNEFYKEEMFKWDIYYIADGNRFVCLDPRQTTQYIEITQNGQGFATKPNNITISPKLIENASVIKFTSGMRKHDKVFDINNPQEPNATFCLNDHDSSFIKMEQQKDVIKENYSKTSIYRNGQKITSVSLEGFKFSSARGGGESLLKTVHHRTEISYETNSNQENSVDEVHGIQQNKNQNQNNLPKNYTRLLEYLKTYDCELIIQYFDNVLENRKKVDEEKRRKIDEEKQAKKQMLAEEQRIIKEKKLAEEQLILEQQRIIKEKQLAEKQLILEQQRIIKEKQLAEKQLILEQQRIIKETQLAEKQLILDQQRIIKEKQLAEERLMSKEDAIYDTDDASDEEPDDASDEEPDEESEEDAQKKHILESKEWEQKLINLLIEHVSSKAYNNINGQKLYELVLNFINN
jgi:hypothetical protein